MTKRIAVILLLLFSFSAFADDEKRPVPDYDGRGDPPTTAGDVLLWIPRIIVSPIYLLTEYVIRRPLGALVRAVESNNVVERVADVLGIGKPVGLVPTFYYDLSVHPHFGLFFFWDGFIFPESHLRATASAGVDYLSAAVLERIVFSPSLNIYFRYNSYSRSDSIFYGIGPATRDEHESRFEIRRIEGSAGAEWGNTQHRLRIEAGMRDIRFGGDSCCDNPSLAQAVGLGFYAAPFGFSDGGYDGPWVHLGLQLDTRKITPATGAGIRLDGELGTDLAHSRSWLRADGFAGASVDVTGTQRVISLLIGASMVEPTQGEDVPFTELIGLGGAGALPAFPAGQLLGRSAIDATLAYEWPIHPYLVGVAHVAVGNVFGPKFEDFDIDLLRFSTGIGMRSIGSPDHRFQMTFAIGTRPFGEGGQIDSATLVFGGVTGF